MKKKKKTNSYLEIPEDFNGFSFKEVKIRRAMLELKRDALKDSMKHSLAEVKRSTTRSSSSNGGTLSRIFSFGSKGAAAATSGKVGAVLKIASVGFEAYKFIRKFKEKRRAKRQC